MAKLTPFLCIRRYFGAAQIKTSEIQSVALCVWGKGSNVPDLNIPPTEITKVDFRRERSADGGKTSTYVFARTGTYT